MGEQARAMAGELDFDLMVLDLNLPRLDGVTILRFLRTRKPSMPILVLTGRTRVEDRVLCLDLGADDYLGKPDFVSHVPNKGFVFYQHDGWNSRIGRRRGRNASRTSRGSMVWICQMQVSPPRWHCALSFHGVRPAVAQRRVDGA